MLSLYMNKIRIEWLDSSTKENMLMKKLRLVYKQRALFIARISQKGYLTIRNTSRWKYNLKIMFLHKLKVVACLQLRRTHFRNCMSSDTLGTDEHYYKRFCRFIIHKHHQFIIGETTCTIHANIGVVFHIFPYNVE